MDMVFYSTCLYYSTSCFIYQFSYICMDAFQILITHVRACGLDMEYQMDVYLT